MNTIYKYKTLSLTVFIVICFSALLLSQGEICNNEYDDDGDGFIDLYDDDCICNSKTFQAQCPNVCPLEIDSLNEIKIRVKWMSNILGQEGYRSLPYNIIASDSVIMINGQYPYKDSVINNVLFCNNSNGEIQKSIPIDTSRFRSQNGIFAFNYQDQIRLCSNTYEGKLVCHDSLGNLLFSNNDFTSDARIMRYGKLSDFNNDGIPEIYGSNKIVNGANGRTIFNGKLSQGCNFWSVFDTCSAGMHSISGDFTASPGLELACGNILYEIEINNLNDTLGNIANIIMAPDHVKDGYTLKSDIDGDGLEDIIVVRSNQFFDGGIWIWNPRDISIIAETPIQNTNGFMGGLPAIQDLDNDCRPEIVIAYYMELRVYSYDGSNTLKLKYSIPTTDESGFTGATIFDLNQDGKFEIIYRDQTHLRIFDGETGFLLDSMIMISGTLGESPIITDVDDDGHAEILIHGGLTDKDSIRLFCIESAVEPWAPARKIWNQTGYHVTNVNDDLTIPSYQQNMGSFFNTDVCKRETCPQVYNNFGMQATYRTQQGCIALPERDFDFSLNDQSLFCPNDSISIMVNDSFNVISWLPSNLVECDTCQNITISSDTSLQIIVLVDQQGCTKSDTFFVYVPETKIIYDSILLCENSDTIYLGEFIENEGDYNFDLNHCDSLLQLRVDVIPTSALKDTILICEGDSLFIGGEWIYTKGDYPLEFETILQCDSFVDLRVEYYPSYNTLDTLFICPTDSILIFDKYESDPFKYERDFSTINTCDSLVAIQLLHFDSYSIADTVAICEGDSIFIHDVWLKEAGDYTLKFKTINECDSIFDTHVTISNRFEIDEDILLCEGDSILIDTIWVKDHGIYPVILTSNMGCDTLINYQVSVEQIEINQETLTLCEGDSLFINGRWIYSGGLYVDTIPQMPCYMIEELTVEELLDTIEEIVITLCPNDSILINGEWISEVGEYEFDFTAANGCDSLMVATVNQLIDPGFPELTIDCESLEILAELSFSDVLWDVVWDDGSSGEFTIYTSSGFGQIELKSITGCNLIHEFILPEIPNIDNIPIIRDTSVILGTELIYSLNLDNDWDVQWTSSLPVSCDTCKMTSIRAIGESNVELELVHSSGCIYTIIFNIDILGQDFDIPNIFSPNEDGENDFFTIDFGASNIKNVNLRIFDRWGNKVADEYGVEKIQWDAKSNGAYVVSGVYVYVLSFENLSGESIQLTGDVTVMR